MSKLIGNQIEELATKYLKARGLSILQRNFYSKFGEIDIICTNAATEELIFVEVRFRTSNDYGTPEATITLQKRKKIILSAKYYLMKHQWANNMFCRFDMLAVSKNDANFEFNWLQNAFN